MNKNRKQLYIQGTMGVSCLAMTTFLCAALTGLPAIVHAQDNVEESDTQFTVMTFNTGTGARVPGDGEDNLGYGREQTRISDEYYGNGLAWKAAVNAVAEFIQAISPDIVAFQEMFYCEECASIPEDARRGFICEDWEPEKPTVARIVLGDDYQIATHPGHPDKCLAVHKSFGHIRGYDESAGIGTLEGFRLEGCGGGARVARAVIERTTGEIITVISYHGTSGISKRDKQCRTKQIEQVFVDFGDGSPAVNGDAHIIIGDFNTDPVRMRCFDRSAKRWNDFVGKGKDFHFITTPDQNMPAYSGIVDIDHIVSDVFGGRVVQVKEKMFPFRMFDHAPIVVEIE